MKKAILWAILGVFFVTLMTSDVWARGRRGFRSGGHSSKIGTGTGSNPSSHSVHGYFRKDGRYVAPHHQSNPDTNFNNNWSTKPNINPYTGQTGTRITPPGASN
jgi:hypothetical protein